MKVAEQKVRSVYYSDEFDEFLEHLDGRIREKYLWTIRVAERIQVLPTK